MNYTKGEWIVHEWGSKFQVVEAQSKIKEKLGITMAGQYIIARDITKANANLIAAAPKLHRAVIHLIGIIASCSPNKNVDQESINVVIMEGNEALAKVEGGK